ncbi:hypothetical protein [Lacipirellula sp.]|uniref:hypothetical protein n=1 Tax=Lacipirellula sp. TaxID=2691419 RepID=UPI003D0A3376
MRRLIAEWLVSRSLDAGREPPRWLRGWLQRDEEAARFEDDARTLAASLRTDAASWRAVDPAAGRERKAAAVTANAPQPRRWLATGLLAGSAAVIGALWLATSGPAEPQPRSIAATPAEAALLVAVVEEGWFAADELLPFGEPFAEWPRLEPPLHGSPAATLGAATGAATRRALAAVDDQVRRQRDALGSQVNASLAFFAYRLPNSAAKVVGLPLGATAETIN